MEYSKQIIQQHKQNSHTDLIKNIVRIIKIPSMSYRREQNLTIYSISSGLYARYITLTPLYDIACSFHNIFLGK